MPLAEPGGQKKPSEQSWHTVAAEAPIDDEKVPPAHCRHEEGLVWPGAAVMYVPAGQEVQAVELALAE